MRRVPLKFGFGRLAATLRLSLLSRSVPLKELMLSAEGLGLQNFAPTGCRRGQFIEHIGYASMRAGIRFGKDWIEYVPYIYDRYYVDLRLSPQAYNAQVEPWKRRQVCKKQRELQAALAGDLTFACYEGASRVEEFFRVVMGIASSQRGRHYRTLPLDEVFQTKSLEAADLGRLVCYALCHRGTAISYLYCPVAGESLVYQFLGYDDRYAKYSPGLILLWSIIQYELAQKRYLYLDFTKGNGQQKRIFATGKLACADVYLLRKTMVSLAVVFTHFPLGRLSYFIERHIKSRRQQRLHRSTARIEP
jgi:CelD/BcsL family acetyltransferase involved in cellulose biosynthesis